MNLLQEKMVIKKEERRQATINLPVLVKNKYKEVIYGLIIMFIKVTNPE